MVLRAQSNYAQAETMFREALALNRKLFGDEHGRVGILVGNLGMLFMDQGAYTEAEPLLLTSIENLKQTLGLAHDQTQRFIESIITLYTTWGQPEQAATYRAMRTEQTP